MIGWLRRRTDTRIDRHGQAILAALADGNAHYVAGDLDRASGAPFGDMHPALARLETDGLVESGWADHDHGRRRRWYRLTSPEVAP